MNHNDMLTESMIRKISDVQLLILRTYGPNAFANFAGWEKRKAMKVKRDPWYRRLK
jgi:hypothetical protein